MTIWLIPIKTVLLCLTEEETVTPGKHSRNPGSNQNTKQRNSMITLLEYDMVGP